jgi:restriction system protein
MKNYWKITAGRGGVEFEDWKVGGYVAVDWFDLGDLTQYATRDLLAGAYKKAYPAQTPGQVRNHINQIWRFVHEVGMGDGVVVYNPASGIYAIGEIQSAAQYDLARPAFRTHYKVAWKSELERSKLSVESRNRLGAILTIFSIAPDTVAEIEALTSGQSSSVVSGDEEFETIKEDVAARANEFIKDKINQLDWEEMQELVAGLLRAMGYKTRVSPRGPDQGRDVEASPDGLGLESPRIVCEVKHRKGAMGAPEIRSFIGALRDEKGVYVSTGGFSKEAKYEAQRAQSPIALLDLDSLARLLVQYYDSFDNEAKALVPLQKLYWPVSLE